MEGRTFYPGQQHTQRAHRCGSARSREYLIELTVEQRLKEILRTAHKVIALGNRSISFRNKQDLNMDLSTSWFLFFLLETPLLGSSINCLFFFFKIKNISRNVRIAAKNYFWNIFVLGLRTGYLCFLVMRSDIKDLHGDNVVIYSSRILVPINKE